MKLLQNFFTYMITSTIEIAIVPITDVFTVPQQSYTLSGNPIISDNSVYLNGMLMLEGLDYSISNGLLTFTGQVIDLTDINIVVQVKYWVLK